MLNVSNLEIQLHPPRRQAKRDAKHATLVRDVSFEIPEGETLALMGETGAGKSITAMAILGLLPEYFRVKGSIELNGRELLSGDARQARKALGRDTFMVLQNAATSLNPSLTIQRQLKEVTDRRHVRERLGGESARVAMIRTLDEVGITDPEMQLRRYPHEFSGGMRQRVVIAMALLAGPELLIADEPTSALDVLTQHSVLTVLRDVQARYGMMTLFISHDFRSVLQLCHRVAVLYAGRLVEHGLVADVLRAPLHPYTRLLRDSIPNLDVRSSLEFQSIVEPPSIFEAREGCPFLARCDRAVARCEVEFPPGELVGSNRVIHCWNPLPPAA